MTERAIHSYVKGCRCTTETKLGPDDALAEFFEEEGDAVEAFLHHVIARDLYFAIHHDGRHVLSVRIGMLVISGTGMRRSIESAH